MGWLGGSPETRGVVHCAGGGSRSASVVIAHVMLSAPPGDLHRTYDGALAFVREIRPVVDPNLGFEAQLRELEAALAAEDARAGEGAGGG
mmetsp:Transcript_44461/g.89717  ORF Transcript_44461/g.89717 Transcript_44461/m.89717 type:complete len:90 (+) Transcript_44461:3-272(+)